MMPLDLFFEIVKLFKDKIAILEREKAEALSNDAADQETIVEALERARVASEEAEQAKVTLQNFQTQDASEDKQLIDVMLAIKSELETV